MAAAGTTSSEHSPQLGWAYVRSLLEWSFRADFDDAGGVGGKLVLRSVVSWFARCKRELCSGSPCVLGVFWKRKACAVLDMALEYIFGEVYTKYQDKTLKGH